MLPIDREISFCINMCEKLLHVFSDRKLLDDATGLKD